MSFTNPFSTKTARVSKILASEVNTAGTYIERSIDGTAGGSYTPSAPIIVLGAQGLQIGSGGFLTVLSGGTLSVPSGGTLSAAAGSTVTLDGTNTLSGTNAVSGATTITGPTTATDFTMTSTNRVKVASRAIVRHQSFSGGTTSANWSYDASTLSWRNTAQSGTVTILLDRLPNGNVLDSVTIRWRGASGHGGLPNPMPSFQVVRLDESETPVVLGIGTDSSASVGAYEAYHDITSSGIAETIDLTQYRYHLAISGEGVTNFVANAKVTHAKVSCTVTSYSEY